MSGQLTFTAEERLLISTLEYDLQRLEHDPEKLFTAWVLKPTYRKAYLDYLLKEVQVFRTEFEALYRLTPEVAEEPLSDPLDWQLPDTYLTALDGFRTRWKLPEGFSREITFTFYLRRCGVAVNGVYAVNKERIEAFRASVSRWIDLLCQDPEVKGIYLQIEKARQRRQCLPPLFGSEAVQSWLPLLGLPAPSPEKVEAFYERELASLKRQLKERILRGFGQEGESLWWQRALQVDTRLEKILPHWKPLYRKHARHLSPEFVERSVCQVFLRVLEQKEWGQIASRLRLPRSTVSSSTPIILSLLGVEP
jgi:hypothetical protein